MVSVLIFLLWLKQELHAQQLTGCVSFSCALSPNADVSVCTFDSRVLAAHCAMQLSERSSGISVAVVPILPPAGDDGGSGKESNCETQSAERNGSEPAAGGNLDGDMSWTEEDEGSRLAKPPSPTQTRQIDQLREIRTATLAPLPLREPSDPRLDIDDRHVTSHPFAVSCGEDDDVNVSMDDIFMAAMRAAAQTHHADWLDKHQETF